MTASPIKNHPNYCPLYYKGLALIEQSDDTASISLCCESKEFSVIDSSFDFINDDFLNKFRTSWQQSPLPNCKTCWIAQSLGKYNSREVNIEWIEKNSIDDPDTIALTRLDYIVGNLCNAKCIICNSNFSSAWAAEDHKFGIPSVKLPKMSDQKSFINNIDFSSLKQLYLTGGEPLMSHKSWAILRKIKQQKSLSDLQLRISTNASVLPDREMISFWKECQSVDIFASLDGIGTPYEYMRYPLRWKEIESNLEKMSAISDNVHINISIAVGVHNIDELPNIYQWFLRKQQQWNLEPHAFGINYVQGNLSLEAASTVLLEIWKQTLVNLPSSDEPWISQVLPYLESLAGQPDNERWQKYLSMIDHRRGLNWKDHLPLLANKKIAL